MEALRQVEDWPVENAAVAAVDASGLLATHGDTERVYRWASVTKLLTAYAALVAAEEGTIDLDEPAGPPGSTRSASPVARVGAAVPAGQPVGRPGARRVYSNPGIELVAEIVAARAEMPFERYLAEAVLEPLGMDAELRGSPAADLYGSLDDLVRFARSCWRRG